jgi:2-dehydro-3-deoxygluconokinase
MYDVVSFGETMIRLTPPDFQRLEQTHSFDVGVSGAELNTATGLARLGLRTAWVSRLVDNPLGRMIANKAREQNVDTSHILWTKDGRVGLYYYEMGASTRASQVIYDRQNSAISQLKPGDIDWATILKGARAFHISGITPALSPSCMQASIEAVAAAKSAGCVVSLDINYRARLWSKQAARECITGMLKDVTILFTTLDEASAVLGLEAEAEQVAREIAERWKVPVVSITLRDAPSVLRNIWRSMAFADGKAHTGRTIPLELIDRMGSGDSYDAGFIYGYLTGDIQKAIAYGDAMSAIKHSVPGDYTWATLAEVKAQVESVQTKIQR